MSFILFLYFIKRAVMYNFLYHISFNLKPTYSKSKSLSEPTTTTTTATTISICGWAEFNKITYQYQMIEIEIYLVLDWTVLLLLLLLFFIFFTANRKANKINRVDYNIWFFLFSLAHPFMVMIMGWSIWITKSPWRNNNNKNNNNKPKPTFNNA